mgnify:CR=1 FL=1
MATVCGGSLAMMDAGVPIKEAVAGIAMGLLKKDDGEFVILSDILGDEDHFGDMDFKVAGTERGVTAFQMDVKIGGISEGLLREALEQARRARLEILRVMQEALPKPRAQISPYAPVLELMRIPVEKIGLVIGPGGRTIRELQETTDTEIEIEDDGLVRIVGSSREGVEAARKAIEEPVSYTHLTLPTN